MAAPIKGHTRFGHWLGRIPLRMACTTTLSAAAMSVCVVFAVAVGARNLWVTVLATNSD